MKADREIKVRCSACGHLTRIPTVTNADRIRSMTDEELAEVISSLGNCDTCYLYHRGCSMKISCKDAVLDWLKQDANNA